MQYIVDGPLKWLIATKTSCFSQITSRDRGRRDASSDDGERRALFAQLAKFGALPSLLFATEDSDAEQSDSLIVHDEFEAVESVAAWHVGIDARRLRKLYEAPLRGGDAAAWRVATCQRSFVKAEARFGDASPLDSFRTDVTLISEADEPLWQWLNATNAERRRVSADVVSAVVSVIVGYAVQLPAIDVCT